MPVVTTSIFACDNCRAQETTEGTQPDGWKSDFNTGRLPGGQRAPSLYTCGECVAAGDSARELALDARKPNSVYAFVDIVFSGDHGPGDTPETTLAFVEVENPARASVRIGEWVNREDGYKVLRIKPGDWMAAG